MPLTRIRQTAIGNDSITSAKLAHDLDLDGDFVRVPHGTTAQRPSSPVAGYMRFNTDQGTLEQWNTNTNSWQAIDSPPIITSLAYTGSATAADPAGGETITLTGTNFKSGASVTIGGTSATSVTVVSSTSITFTTPVKTAGDYDVVVTNSNGLQATLTNGISYNGTPSFTTAAGNVGSIAEDSVMSTITIVAAEPDGGTLAFSVTSGALPTGVSLGSANGQLTGTPNTNITSDTTFNFTVTATDDENQTNSRAFNLIVLRPVYATQISNSLKLSYSSTSSLTKTWGGNATDGTRGTMSAWVKRGILTNGTGNAQYWFHSGTGTDNSGHMDIKFGADDTISIGRYSDTPLSGTSKHRDPTAWMHIVVVWDTTDASAANNKVTVYVNGTAMPGSYANISQNDVFPWTKNGNALYIGKHATVNRPFDGYLADIHLIDGQALAPTSFAEEFNGVWTPKAYSGTYGNNGFKLNFANSADIGNDVSGNNNDLTPANINARDVFPDSPTTNFATFNYNNFPVMTFAEGALKITTTTNNTTVYGSQAIPDTGKWYFEMEATNYVSGGGSWNGLGYETHLGDNELSQDGIRLATYYGGIYVNNSVQSGGYGNTGNGVDQTADGDVYSFAIDMDNQLFYIAKNGTWYNSANPSSGTGGLDISANITAKGTKPYVPAVGRGGSLNETYTWNFGQDSTFDGGRSATSNADANGVGKFAYTVPTNFLSLCAKNLSEGAITVNTDDRPEDYFNTVLYTGNGSSSSVTVGFQPDFTWIKVRGATYDHQILDTVRGYGTKLLYTNLNNGEDTSNPARVTQDSNGFTTIDSPQVNANGQTYVAWNWKAGGQPTATNSAGVGAVPTSGSVLINGSASTSTLAGTIAADKMSVNSKAGFSIVKYTGNATGGATVAHGLGSTPDMIILKCSSAAANWRVYVNGVSLSNTLFLNSTSGQTADGDRISAVNSTTFTLSSGNGAVNGSGSEYIAYCWKSVPGYSKMGTFTGQGDKTTVHTGFKPAFLMVKNFNTSTHHWAMYDNKRNTYNVVNKFVYANSTGGDNTADRVDFVSNGFVGRANNYDISQAGVGFVYMAFAEDPFKYSEAR